MVFRQEVADLIGRYSFIKRVEKRGIEWVFFYEDKEGKKHKIRFHIRHYKDYVIKELNKIKKKLGLKVISNVKKR